MTISTPQVPFHSSAMAEARPGRSLPPAEGGDGQGVVGTSVRVLSSMKKRPPRGLPLSLDKSRRKLHRRLCLPIGQRRQQHLALVCWRSPAPPPGQGRQYQRHSALLQLYVWLSHSGAECLSGSTPWKPCSVTTSVRCDQRTSYSASQPALSTAAVEHRCQERLHPVCVI